jgi:hypothetical protein
MTLHQPPSVVTGQPGASPIAGNPFVTRDDMARAVRELTAPMLRHLSPGGARVRLGALPCRYARDAAEMEGMARLLWGLAPLAAGGFEAPGLDRLLDGIAAGTDPAHPEYWGAVSDRDQRMVEMAALGFTFALLGDKAWGRYDARTRRQISDYLNQINHKEPNQNNWQFFRVLVNLGLRTNDAPHDWAAVERSLAKIDSYALPNGWYFDGRPGQRDHYVAFALHLYGLIYARFAGDWDPVRAARFKERAAAFAPAYRSWFARDGAGLAFGRSMTYRFAMGSFWGGLALADVEALPWGEIKGVALRHLRWWTPHPIAERDGVLSIGFTYPNYLMSEQYNSAGSPYWALKAMLPLALPETHPFWAAQEQPDESPADVVSIPEAGMVVARGARHNVALGVGQENLTHRGGIQKYAKFAYSTYLSFCVESVDRLAEVAGDNMLVVSDDGLHVAHRETHEACEVGADHVTSRWSPLPGVWVESAIIAWGEWHVRVHRLVTDRPLALQEGGFALPVTDAEAPEDFWNKRTVEAAPCLVSSLGFSGLLDLSGGRASRMTVPLPCTNLAHERTVVPKLVAEVPAGTHLLITAVLGTPDAAAGQRAWDMPPTRAEVLAHPAAAALRGGM